MPAILPMIPATFENYIEPFAGGCALLVELYNLGRIRHAIISDLNGELINLYTVVRNSPGRLIDEIAALPFGNSSISYYSARERFNDILGLGDSMIERATLFLYLNRHGYNGLWRVNASGKFNVPFGRYRNPAMPGPEHIMAFSRMLSLVDIYNCDFADTCSKASAGDLVYLDPPYFPLSSTSNFTAYSSGGFPYTEQKRLRDECVEIGKRGARIIFNNSWSPEISSLYEEFFSVKIASTRMINSNSGRRSGHFDLLGSNFTLPDYEIQIQ
ncbi:MAG: DNA adenine methylase [Candidatus Thermoplasmatota archaeon]|nr:DNA adenine methylase [Candidatus Thermoplasmatota archaeon]MCL5668380.1 DNA adenine methylase [Candidatus Thermoplasmatota archaeon]